MRLSLRAAVVMLGFASVVGQVVLLRELATVFYGNELVLGVILASWLFWVGAGSFLGGRVLEGRPGGAGPSTFALGQFFFSLFLILSVVAVRAVRPVLGAVPGELIGFLPVALASFVILAPVSLMVGAEFTLACHLARLGRGADSAPGASASAVAAAAAGEVYLLDGLGDLLGGLAFGYLMVTRMPALSIVVLMGVLTFLTGTWLVLEGDRRAVARFAAAPLLFLFALGGAFALLAGGVTALSRQLDGWEWGERKIIARLESRYGTLTVTEEAGRRSFYQNGVFLFATPEEVETEYLVHLPFLEHPDPRRALVIGSAGGSVLAQCLRHPVERIHYVEIDPALLELGRRFGEEEFPRLLEDPRVEVVTEDGRLFVRRHQGPPVDVVLLNVTDPTTAQINRFYTREFFQELKRIMSPEGVVSLRISSNENYLSPAMAAFNASIYRTLAEAFPALVLIPGETLTLLASPSSRYLTGDAGLIAARLEERRLETRFLTVEYLPFILYGERMRYIEDVLANEPHDEVNEDLRPLSYYFDLVLLSSYFDWGGKRLWGRLMELRLWHLGALAFLAATLLVVCSRVPGRAVRGRAGILGPGAAVFALGLAGMVLEVALLFGFQVVYGYVYHRLGILVAAFMAGLVLGSWIMTRALGRLSRPRFSLALLLVAGGGGALLVPLFLRVLAATESPTVVALSVELLFPLITAVVGLLVGLAFPLANRLALGVGVMEPAGGPGGGRAAAVAGTLYALDLAGACMGALLASAVLVPVLGIAETCHAAALICAACLLLFGFVPPSVPVSTAATSSSPRR